MTHQPRLFDLWTLRDKETGEVVWVDPLRDDPFLSPAEAAAEIGQAAAEAIVVDLDLYANTAAELLIGGEPDLVEHEGRRYHLDRVRLDELAEYLLEHNLAILRQPAMLRRRWPPMLLATHTPTEKETIE